MSKPINRSHRAAVFALFVCLWAAILTVAASAAFSDVKPESWYYADVTALAEAGIINGYPDGSYRPEAAVSYAEAIKIILGAADYSVIHGGAVPWYRPYIAYAAERGIIDEDNGIRPNDALTRDRAAELIVRAMGLPLDVDTAARPFADSANVYAITLHTAGIIRGELTDGVFYYRGERSLNRAELAAIASRMMRYTKAQLKKPIPEHPLLPDGVTLPESPKTVEDFVQMLIYLSVNGIEEHTFIYRGVDVDTVEDDYLANLTEAYAIATDLCRESVVYYHYYNINLAYTRNYVAMTLKLRGREYTARECRAMFDFTVSAAEAAVAEIRTGMPVGSATPERDYARACLDWVVTHCRYQAGQGLLDQYAYSVFRLGESVCSGYTAAYNLLLKLGGIKCMSMTGTVIEEDKPVPHAWTIAELDGARFWIDATWCDPIGQADDATNHRYFAIDEREFALTHTPKWDYLEYWHLAG